MWKKVDMFFLNSTLLHSNKFIEIRIIRVRVWRVNKCNLKFLIELLAAACFAYWQQQLFIWMQ